MNFRMILAPSGEEVRLSYMPVPKLNRMVHMMALTPKVLMLTGFSVMYPKSEININI